MRYPHLPELLEVPDKRIGMISLKRKYVDIIIAAKDRMVRVGDWKLTYQPLTDGAMYRLFNIREDPGCLRNVAGSISRDRRAAQVPARRLDGRRSEVGPARTIGAVVSARTLEQDAVAGSPAVSGNLS